MANSPGYQGCIPPPIRSAMNPSRLDPAARNGEEAPTGNDLDDESGASSAMMDHSRPTILTLQPRPLQCLVSYLCVGSRVVTAITRLWREGDPSRCRLCQACTARDNLCNLPILGYVEESRASLFSTVNLRRQSPLVARIAGEPTAAGELGRRRTGRDGA